MNWYNKVFADEKEKDKINKLPRIKNYLPDEEVTYTGEFDIIFSDYFKDYSDVNVDEAQKLNPANIPTTQENMKLVNAIAGSVTEGSLVNRSLRTVKNFVSATAGSLVNFATGWFYRPAGQPLRLGGDSTTLSRKPKNKNKKTKKLNRDKR